jgi:hypothetical protein
VTDAGREERDLRSGDRLGDTRKVEVPMTTMMTRKVHLRPSG